MFVCRSVFDCLSVCLCLFVWLRFLHSTLHRRTYFLFLFQLTDVVEICSDFLKKQLHPSNCLGIRAFADAQGVTELWRSANEYTSEHIMEVMRNQEFVLLPTDHVIALLGNDDLNIPNEETILGAVLDWVKYDLSARKKHLAKLLAQVRLICGML